MPDPLQHSCLGDPMDRGAWQDTVHGMAKQSDMTVQLSNNNRMPDLPYIIQLSLHTNPLK